MANFALAVNLITYFNSVMHFELADAANQLTNYMGTGYILSILMAILADTYLGRVKTIIISGCLEFLVRLTSLALLCRLYLLPSNYILNYN